MLIGLSVRNAKRQSREYLLYFITLACSVSFIYAFNTLIFSDLITDLPDLENITVHDYCGIYPDCTYYGVDYWLHDKLYVETAEPGIKYLYVIRYLKSFDQYPGFI